MKLFFLLLAGLLLVGSSQAQLVERGTYRIVKLDGLNLMGIGVQKIHLGYECSPIKVGERHLPTVQYDLTIPFNSFDEIVIHGGLELGTQIRFYRGKGQSSKRAEGFYYGFGMEAGWVKYGREHEYALISNNLITRLYEFKYSRIRTGLFALIGAQAIVGDKLHFDMTLGLGWSNIQTSEDIPALDPNYRERNDFNETYNPVYLMYDKGNYQQVYVPVSFSIGYNLGRG